MYYVLLITLLITSLMHECEFNIMQVSLICIRNMIMIERVLTKFSTYSWLRSFGVISYYGP